MTIETNNAFNYILICSMTTVCWVSLDLLSMLLAGKNLPIYLIGLHSLITTAVSYLVYNIGEYCFTRSFHLILVFRRNNG